jgi:outer membrane lipoprotein-sorting protein
MRMLLRSCSTIVGLLLVVFSLSGCPKPARIPPIETPPVKNPVTILLDAFSDAKNFQSRASIRVEIIRKTDRMNFLLNGTVFYQNPDKLRILGYHPFGMGLFDALYQNGEFFLLSPLEKKAYTGEVSDFEDLIEKAGVRIVVDKTPGSKIPDLIRIGVEEPETRVNLRLRDIEVNSTLPEDAFRWYIPEGVEVMSLAQLLRKRPL